MPWGFMCVSVCVCVCVSEKQKQKNSKLVLYVDVKDITHIWPTSTIWSFRKCPYTQGLGISI